MSYPALARVVSVAILAAANICIFNIDGTIAQTSNPPTTTSPATGAQETNVQETYAKAIDLLQAGKTADALTIIDAAIKAGANDPSLYNLKGKAASELVT